MNTLVRENEQRQTSSMPEVWKTIGLCDRARKKCDILATTASEREAGRHLHGMFSEEVAVNGSD
jgi:hypothetical protein